MEENSGMRGNKEERTGTRRKDRDKKKGQGQEERTGTRRKDRDKKKGQGQEESRMEESPEKKEMGVEEGPCTRAG